MGIIANKIWPVFVLATPIALYILFLKILVMAWAGADFPTLIVVAGPIGLVVGARIGVLILRIRRKQAPLS